MRAAVLLLLAALLAPPLAEAQITLGITNQIHEGDTAGASINATRTGCVRYGYSVVSGGTAESGDYTLLRTHQSNWCPNAGNTLNQSNILRANQDSDAEDETLFMQLTNHGSLVGERRTVTILDDDAPTAPTGFTVTAGDTGALLAWTDPSNANITRWEYQQKAGSGAWGNWTRIPSSGAATTNHAVRRLTNGTEYAFKLRAVNRNGDGAASAEKSATPVSSTSVVPLPPSNLTARAGIGEVALKWDWTARAGRSSVGQWNDLTWDLWMNGSWTRIVPEAYDQEVLTVKVRYTVTGLTNGTAYTFRVRANNAAGTGDAHGPATATPSGTPAPGKPTLTVESNVPGGVTLTAQVDTSYAVTGWEVKRGTGAWTAVNEPQNPPQLLVTFLRGLTWDTAYTFKVRALNGTTTGAESDAVRVTTKGKDHAVPAITNLAVVKWGVGGVVLAWVTPKAKVTEYHLMQNGELAPGTLATRPDDVWDRSNWTVATLTNLSPGERYTFNVRAKNGNLPGEEGTGPWSKRADIKLDPVYVAPDKPYLRIIPLNNQAELVFHTPWYPDRTAEIVSWHFRVRHKTGSEAAAWGAWSDFTFMSLEGWDQMSRADRAQSPPSYLVSHVPRGGGVPGAPLQNHVPPHFYNKYEFQVAALAAASANVVQVSSDAVAVFLEPAWAKPSKPTNLQGTPGNGQVTLTWEAGTTGSPASLWMYQQSGDWMNITGSNRDTRSHVVTGLTNDTAYAFRVRGQNNKGEGPASDPVTVTPKASAGGQGGAGGAEGEGGEGGENDGTSTDPAGTPVPALPLAALGLLAALLAAGATRARRRLTG